MTHSTLLTRGGEEWEERTIIPRCVHTDAGGAQRTIVNKNTTYTSMATIVHKLPSLYNLELNIRIQSSLLFNLWKILSDIISWAPLTINYYIYSKS